MGFAKSDPYGAEEPPPERQLPDLLTNQTVSHGPPTQRPPEMGARGPVGNPPPRRYRRRPPAWPSVLFLIGVALIIGSLFGAWWTYTVQEPNQDGTVAYNFLLGSQYSIACSGGSDCAREPTGLLSYGSDNLGAVGDLYEGALALMLVGLTAAIAASVIGILAALGRWQGRLPSLLVPLLALVAFGLVLGAAISVAALQPSALTQTSGGIAPGGAPSPATSFWGSCSGSGLGNGACSTNIGSISAQWGAGLGWYLAIFAVLALLVGLVLQVISRPVRGDRI